MFVRKPTFRSFGRMALLGVAAGSTLLLAACSSQPTSTSTSTNPSLTACTSTVADITAGAGGKSTAPKYPGASGTIQIDGSTALSPLFEQVGAEFDAANGTHTTVTPNGSGTGLSDVSKGAVQIGLSDLFQADKGDSGLTDHQVAVVAFILVVNDDLKGKVDNLTISQIQQIYNGSVTNWSQIGGPNETITVVNRPSTSGTRGTFEKYVLGATNEIPGDTLTEDTTGAVFDAVNATPGSIGYVSTGFVTSATSGPVPQPLCINGYKADETDINSGNYPFWNIEHAYTKAPATGTIKDLLTYVESTPVQTTDLPSLNFYQLSSISAAAKATHEESGAPTPESFYPNS